MASIWRERIDARLLDLDTDYLFQEARTVQFVERKLEKKLWASRNTEFFEHRGISLGHCPVKACNPTRCQRHKCLCPPAWWKFRNFWLKGKPPLSSHNGIIFILTINWLMLTLIRKYSVSLGRNVQSLFIGYRERTSKLKYKAQGMRLTDSY